MRSYGDFPRFTNCLPAADVTDSEQDVEQSVEADQDSQQEDMVFTAGVQSTVINQQDAVIGHVLLVDADDAGVLDLVALAEQMDGITALLESSPNSWHLWNLTVRDREQQTLRQLDLHVEDDKHAGNSYRRGYSVLRYTSKVFDSGETYKPAPKLRDVFVNPSDDPQSRSHCEALLSLAQEQGYEAAADRLERAVSDQSLRMVGDPDTLLMDEYGTLSDAAKADVRGD
jgi:hypothetical protein